MDLMEIITLAGPAGVVSAIVTHLLGLWPARTRERRDVGHLALQLAVLFEHYASQCGDMAATTKLHVTSAGKAGSINDAVVTLQPFPDQLEAWRLLDPLLRNEVMSFPLEIAQAQQHLEFLWEEGFRPGDDTSGYEFQIKLGVKAMNLASGLRRKYGWGTSPSAGLKGTERPKSDA